MLQSTLCLIGLSGVLLSMSPPESPKVDRSHHFPFPVEVDRAKGSTGIYPNRIRDRKTGIWYVLVPGGEYQIGDAKHSDSKPIKVTLSPFYISEKQVTCKQMATYIERRFEEKVKEEEKVLNPIPRKEATAAEVQDLHLQGEGWAASWMHFDWPQVIGSLSRVDPEDPPFDYRINLTPKEREKLKALVGFFKKQLATLQAEGDAPYGKAHFPDALGFAKSCGVDLPTETQWETAARLHEAKRIRLDGLFDEILEWCSDYYDHDYFQRNNDLRDPKGPPRGHLSKEQLRKEIPPSSLGFRTRRIATRFRVLRGVDATTRLYGRGEGPGLSGWADPFRRLKGIRLVYNPRPR